MSIFLFSAIGAFTLLLGFHLGLGFHCDSSKISFNVYSGLLHIHMSFAASFQNTQGNQGDSDPNNTTIFVGGLDPNVTDDLLKQVFSPYGELVHVKIPMGKRCGFVQFANRPSAEQALSSLNGTQLGGQSIRLSWGRSPSNRQSDQTQLGGSSYYGYSQGGYEGYGSYAPPQDPNMYYGGAGYANYQQPQQ